jgi:hypothetical protein
VSQSTHVRPGFKNSADFSEFHRNSVDPCLSEYKIQRFLDFKFRNFKKIIYGKICKKTRSNSKNIGERKFFKSRPFYWIKFKLNKNVKIGPLDPLLTYIVFPLSLGRTEVHDSVTRIRSEDLLKLAVTCKNRWSSWRNRPASAGNRPTRPISRPRRDGGWACKTVARFRQKIAG